MFVTLHQLWPLICTCLMGNLYSTTNSDGLFYNSENLKAIYIFFSELSMAAYGLPCKGKDYPHESKKKISLHFISIFFLTHRVNKGSWIITEKYEEIL